MVDVMETPEPKVSRTKNRGHVRQMIHLFSNGGILWKGSEPSLTSRNGHSKCSSSSVDASKHTLHSQDEVSMATSPTKVQVASIKPIRGQDSNPEDHVTSNYVMSRILTIENNGGQVNSDDVDHSVIQVSSPNTPGSPKTPSYLKLSCAISGYNRYNSYNNNNPSNTDSPATPHKGQLTPINTSNTDAINEARISHSLVDNKTHHVHKVTNGDICDVDTTRTNGAGSQTGHTSQTHHSNTPPAASPVLVNGISPSQTPAKTAPKTDIATPNKDGAYFLQVVDAEELRLKELCAIADKNLQDDIPEEASGRVRAAIGKASLLTTKKFKQFRGLCHQNLSQAASEPFHTTCQDLAGFWDLVLIQVEDVCESFSELERMKRNGWDSPIRDNQTVSTSLSRTSISKGPATPRGKSSTSVKDAQSLTPKSSKSKEAAKAAREEARKRLLAAKRAGRQRKASQSDDVEIYVS